MAINQDDPNLYHHLCMIAEAFEKAALKSETRAGFMINALGPLQGMETLVEGSEEILDSTNRAQANPNASSERIAFDTDLQELMGPEDSAGGRVAQYLSECLGCDLRLQFDWQLRPLNLLGPIEAMFDQLKGALDLFLDRIDPFKSLTDLCDLLNALKGFCIPDLIMVLMSLKLILRKYMTNIIEVKLDWTVILGPLLKLILEGITSLLENLAALLLAPLDCAVSALYTLNALEKEARSVVAGLDNLFSSTANLSLDAEPLGKTIGWSDSVLDDKDKSISQKAFGEFPEAPEYGTMTTEVGLFGEQTNEKGITVPAGFDVRAVASIEDALKHPAFLDSTFIEKLIIPLQEVIGYIQDLVGNINKALNSLNQLAGGGLSINLNKLGVLLFVADMISIIMMIIRMLKANPGQLDWCRILQENPTMLENELRGRMGAPFQDLRVETTPSEQLLLRVGSEVVGEVRTCATKRTEIESSTIKAWISELERGRVK